MRNFLLDLPLPASLLVLMTVLVIACFIDVRVRRIPNWLVLIGLIGVVSVRYVQWGQPAMQEALIGILIAFVVTAPLVMLRVFGAGDSKLMLVVGAALEPSAFFTVLVLAFLLSGVIGLLGTLFNGRVKVFLANLNIGIVSALNFDWSTAKTVTTHSAYRVPFALPVAVGVLVWLYWFF